MCDTWVCDGRSLSFFHHQAFSDLGSQLSDDASVQEARSAHRTALLLAANRMGFHPYCPEEAGGGGTAWLWSAHPQGAAGCPVGVLALGSPGQPDQGTWSGGGYLRNRPKVNINQ